MRVLLAASLLLLSSMTMSGDGCSIEEVRLYEKTVGGGGPDDVRITTVHCADFLIRNTSDGSRFDPTVHASFSDGSSAKEKVKTSRIQPGETHPGDLCFGGARVRQLSCSW